MKRDAIKTIKSKITTTAKITPQNKKLAEMESDPKEKDKKDKNNTADDAMDNDGVSDVFDTPLTLTHSSNNTDNDVIFINSDIFNNNDDELADIAEDNADNVIFNKYTEFADIVADTTEANKYN